MRQERMELKGVITIEMSYLLPVIFVLFSMIVYTVFYYHDKNILIGAAGETAVVGTQIQRKPDETGQTDMESFFQERIRGKLILFGGADVTVDVSEDWVCVSAAARKRGMSLNVTQKAEVTEAEKTIRRKRIAESVIERSEEDGT